MALAKLYEEDIQTNVSASNIIDISEFRKMHKAQKELLEDWLTIWGNRRHCCKESAASSVLKV